MIRHTNDLDAPVAASVDSLAIVPLSVVIVTAGAEGDRSCATATATYASLDPPMVVVPLKPTSRTYVRLVEGRRFSVAVVASHEVDLASRAARRWPGTDKIDAGGFEVVRSPEEDDVVAVATGAGALWCDVEALVPTGDHVLVTGRVRWCSEGVRSPEPLLRHKQRYRLAGPAMTEPGPREHPL